MSDCKSCKYKNDGCFCPPDKYCVLYKKEKHKIKHNFEFETNDDWTPGNSSCWVECPFSSLIPLGQACGFFISENVSCPFIAQKKLDKTSK